MENMNADLLVWGIMFAILLVAVIGLAIWSKFQN
jgi:hypothetical protein